MRLLAVGLFAHCVSPAMARGSEEVTSPASPDLPLPSIGLRIAGESPLPRPVLEQEMSKTVGRTFVAEGAGTEGMVTLTFDKDPTTGVVHVRVQYEPPPEQLVRDDVMPREASQITARLANLVQSLLYRDAGVTVVTPPPPPLPPTPPGSALETEKGAACPEGAPPQSSPNAPAAATASVEAPRETPAFQRWQVSAGVRGGVFGSARASGLEGSGAIGSGVSLLGGSIRLLAPGGRKFRLGVEGVVDFVDGSESSSDGTTYTTNAVYAGLSAVGSVQLWSKRGFDVNLSGHLGLIRTAQLDFDGFTDTSQQTAGDLGSRAGAAFGVDYWLSDRLALTGLMGFDRVFIAARALESETQSADQNEIVRQDVNMTFTLPYLRLGAIYRF